MLKGINPDGKQNEVLALPPFGHTVVLGTAGSGKTTMALLRAIGLSKLPTRPNVLVVTFNGALVQYMEQIANSSLPNITIENFHRFARGYLNSRGKMPHRNGIIDSRDKENYIEQAVHLVREKSPHVSTLQRPTPIFIDEINFIEGFGFTCFDEYYAAERIGRASANIKRENRKWFYAVFETYRSLRSNSGYMYDWEDLAYYAYHELISDTTKRRYDHIIVDEGQDFSPMMIKALTAAVDASGSFTFFGDVAQQIYGSRLSWRDSGINIRDGKIWKFDRNYRNPATIMAFAKDITNSVFWDSKEDMVSPVDSIAAGPKPVLVNFSTYEHELSWLISQVESSQHTASNVIICRNRSTIDILKRKFLTKHIPVTVINKDHAGFSSIKGIYLSTYHAAKGLEFENVFIPFLCDNIMPDPDTIATASDIKTAMANELKLLYVASTRSKFGLFMSFHGQLTPLFPNTSKNYNQINGDELI